MDPCGFIKGIRGNCPFWVLKGTELGMALKPCHLRSSRLDKFIRKRLELHIARDAMLEKMGRSA